MTVSSHANVEVLAHIARPSCSSDDALYRHQALAYLGFEPARRTGICKVVIPAAPRREHDTLSRAPLMNDSRPRNAGASQSQGPSESITSPPRMPACRSETICPRRERERKHEPEPGPGPLISTASHYYEVSRRPPSQLSLDPGLLRQLISPLQEVIAASWKQQQPRTIEDSCPENDVRLAEFCSPTLAFMQLLQSPFNTPVAPSPRPRERQQPRSQSLGCSPRPLLDRPSSPPLPRPTHSSRVEVPSTAQSPPLESPKPATDDDNDDDNNDNNNNNNNSSSNNGIYTRRPRHTIRHSIRFSPPCTSSSAEAPSSDLLAALPSPVQSPCAARKRKASDLFENRPTGSPAHQLVVIQRADSAPVGSPSHISESLISSAATTGPRFLERTQSDVTSNRARQVHATPLLNTTNYLTTLFIEPPLPPVSLDHVRPDDLLTAGLVQLEAQLGLSRRFRPEGKRDPRPFERGYWLLDLRTYPADLRRTMWVFFGNYIGAGLAGWGVWCSRDGEEDIGAGASVSQLRVYCWGRVVGHVWLLIYLASKRKTKETGGVWIGGDGANVCTVRPW